MECAGALGAALPQAVVKAGQHAVKSNGILNMTPSVMNSTHLHCSREWPRLIICNMRAHLPKSRSLKQSQPIHATSSPLSSEVFVLLMWDTSGSVGFNGRRPASRTLSWGEVALDCFTNRIPLINHCVWTAGPLKSSRNGISTWKCGLDTNSAKYICQALWVEAIEEYTRGPVRGQRSVWGPHR